MSIFRVSKMFVASILICCPVVGLVQALDWPQWRGPDRTDVSRETGLLKEWPAGGPKQVWLYKEAGNGYSAPAIVNGKLFTMGTRDGAECVIALEAGTGKELWVTKIEGGLMREGHGDGPRGTPTVDGDRLYALSGTGELVCIGLADGKTIWQTNMRTLGGSRPNWGFTESVLVDGDVILCTPGGAKGTVAALDKKSGAVKWQSADLTEAAHYSSIVPAEINGTRQYVQRTASTVFGLTVNDGKLLWKAPFPGRTAVVPTPIVRGNEVYVAAGYGVGCMMVGIGKDNVATQVYSDDNRKLMVNHHGGVVLVGDHLYGYSDSQGWLCQDFKTGDKVWASRALGKGAIACADGMLYCLDEGTGTLVLIDASPKGWQEHGRFKLDPQSSIRAQQGRVWTHPVISNGRLYLRDQDLISCYDIKAK